jgi:hypothetical protein
MKNLNNKKSSLSSISNDDFNLKIVIRYADGQPLRSNRCDCCGSSEIYLDREVYNSDYTFLSSITLCVVCGGEHG